MTRFAKCSLLTAALLLVASCSSSTEPASDACPQTYEFGNYGCARVVVHLDGAVLMQPLPVSRIIDVRATPVTARTGLVGGFMSAATTGFNLLEVTKMMAPPNDTDTMSVWVYARYLDASNSRLAPLPVVAIDSVQHLVRFAPVDSRPVVDTVWLSPRKPAGTSP